MINYISFKITENHTETEFYSSESQLNTILENHKNHEIVELTPDENKLLILRLLNTPVEI